VSGDEHIETGLGWPAETTAPAADAATESSAPPASAAALSGAPGHAAEGPANASAAAPSGARGDAAKPSSPQGEDGARERREPPERSDGQQQSEPPERSEGQKQDPKHTVSSAGMVIGLLLALLGFTMVVQLKSNATDPTLASARQEDLVRILSDLTAQEQRLRQDISNLQDTQRQLSSGVQGREAALEEARKRADALGILAGTLPAQGTGLTVRFAAGAKPIAAASILDAVQELRGAGAEAMQVSGAAGGDVRVIASTYFIDRDGGIEADGRRLTGPYTISVIGDPTTMRTALNIPGGVVEEVAGGGGNVTVQEPGVVDVTALHAPTSLQHARPGS
jgi:uncharacterized protein YlxW (UPF0749 family)